MNNIENIGTFIAMACVAFQNCNEEDRMAAMYASLKTFCDVDRTAFLVMTMRIMNELKAEVEK